MELLFSRELLLLCLDHHIYCGTTGVQGPQTTAGNDGRGGLGARQTMRTGDLLSCVYNSIRIGRVAGRPEGYIAAGLFT
eukprot:469047-Pelagomonas_calceolata.AAC.6